VARRSIVHAITGRTPSPWLFAVLAIAAVAIDTATNRERRTRFVLLLYGALLTAGLALQIQVGARLQSDGFYYFSYLRSLAFDRDVDFANDYRLLGLGGKADLFGPTRTGHAHSAWTIGPAIVWAPFFAAGHIVAAGLHRAGADVATDGTSYPYRQAICAAGLVYGLLGCWFCYRLTRRLFPAEYAAAAVALVISGSFMLWYLVKEPSMTHAPSMAGVAALAWAWLATRDARTLRAWALLGALAGFVTLIRWQNALFAILPAWDAASGLIAGFRAADRAAVRRLAIGSAAFVVCATLAFVPQMLAWRAIYGSWLAVSPLGPTIHWSNPQLADILWSARNGLLSTAPILYVAAIGLVIFAVTRPPAGAPMLAAVLLMTYFNACIEDWWGSAGFGGRRFDGAIPFFCVGLAAFGERAVAFTRRHAFAAVTAAAALLAVWNLTLVGAAERGAVRIGETVPFDRAWAAQTAVAHSWIGNPFTYPASLLFALRNGMSPARYDLLSGNRFIGDPKQPFARIDLGGDDEWLIEEGWHAAEREGQTTFRWAETPASVLVPLDHAAPLRVQIRIHAFAFAGAPPQSLTLLVNGRTLATLAVPPDWQTLESATPAEAWHSGVNTLTLEFAWARRPVDVGAGGDTRPLSAALDYVRLSVNQ
jgi:hypothetical protein